MDRKEKVLFVILGVTAGGIIVYEVVKGKKTTTTTTVSPPTTTTKTTPPTTTTTSTSPPTTSTTTQQQQNIPPIVQDFYSKAWGYVPPEYEEKTAPGYSSCAGGYIRQYKWCYSDSENVQVNINNQSNVPVVIQLWYCRNNWVYYEDPAGGGNTKPIVVPANSSITHSALPYTMYTIVLWYPGGTTLLCYDDCVVPGKDIVIPADKIQGCQKEAQQNFGIQGQPINPLG